MTARQHTETAPRDAHKSVLSSVRRTMTGQIDIQTNKFKKISNKPKNTIAPDSLQIGNSYKPFQHDQDKTLTRHPGIFYSYQHVSRILHSSTTVRPLPAGATAIATAKLNPAPQLSAQPTGFTQACIVLPGLRMGPTPKSSPKALK